MIKNKNGITLIALVITIIVLLILASVSIAMLTGENGILTQAQRAKEETDKASNIEEIKLAIEQAKMEDTLDTIDFNNAIKEELEKQYPETSVISNNIIKVIYYKDNTYIINTGTGEVKTDIIPIYTAEQLVKIAEVCESGAEQIVNINGVDYTFSSSSVYSLQNDIDLSSFCSEGDNKSWNSIGRLATNSFSGIFLGNSHEITNIYINNMENGTAGEGIGFFGAIKDYAVIDGLTVSGKIINNGANTDVGGIVGSTLFYSNASISNCYNRANIINNKSGYSAGGILGGRSI